MRWAWLIAWFWLGSSVAYARPVPSLVHRVNDTAGLLSSQEQSVLEQTLAAYEQKTGHQWALLTIDTLDGEPIEMFSIKVVDAWKLGNAKADNGLLMIVVARDRKMRIEVGYGLEGSVTDAVSSQVIRNIMRPAFRKEQYAEGIFNAFQTLMRAAQGEVLSIPKAPRNTPEDSPGLGIFGMLILFLLFMIIPSRWRLPLLMYILSNRSNHRGGWSSHGGGFGGGGGGFGGGGASGDW